MVSHFNPVRSAFRLFEGWFIIILFLLGLHSSCTYLPEGQQIDQYENIVTENGDYLIVTGSGDSIRKIFLFIPGGFVDPHAYLCWINQLVTSYPDCAVISMKIPSNLAILNQGKVDLILKKYESVTNWIIGGHSLGGTVAANAIIRNPDKFEGLILLASYSTSFADLSNWEGDVLSIYGTVDGVATFAEIEKNYEFLPQRVPIDSTSGIVASGAQTFYYGIPGGNHSGFGCYGFQEGDNTAEITSLDQQEYMIQVITKFLDAIWE